MVKSVLAAIPLHRLVVLDMNKKTRIHVDKILRGFLWVGRASANGGHWHINCIRVCRPLCLGGLSVPDMGNVVTSPRVR